MTLTAIFEGEILGNLLSRIASACAENVSTEVLAYLLENSPTYRAEFLRLIGCKIDPDKLQIQTQYNAGQEGYADLALKSQNHESIVLIENKPWLSSMPTSRDAEGDQLKRYAKHLHSLKKTDKTLCLLARQNNKVNILSVTAESEGINYTDLESLVQYYDKKYGITFVVITWDEIFKNLEGLDVINPSDNKSLLDELNAYIFPPRDTIPPNIENFQDCYAIFKRRVDEANRLVFCQPGIKSSGRPTGCNPRWWFYSGRAELWGEFFWGTNVDDNERMLKHGKKSNHPFFFNIQVLDPSYIDFLKNKKTKEQKHAFLFRNKQPLFFFNEKLTKDFLNDCGFVLCEERWANLYIKPLELEFNDINDITPEEIGKAVLKIIDDVTIACKKTMES